MVGLLLSVRSLHIKVLLRSYRRRQRGLEDATDGGLGTLNTTLLIFPEKVANLLRKSLATLIISRVALSGRF